MRKLVAGMCLAAAVAGASCGDVVRSSRSPVLLTVTSLSGGDDGGNTFVSDVLGFVTSPAPCTTNNPCPTVFNDFGAATLTVAMKNISVAPTTNNRVTLHGYRVEFRRTDGRNTPGVDVPHPFAGGLTASIAAGASGGVTFELVRHTAKTESPLVELVVNGQAISVIADVTFFGTDQVGNDVSATGSMQITFLNFG